MSNSTPNSIHLTSPDSADSSSADSSLIVAEEVASLMPAVVSSETVPSASASDNPKSVANFTDCYQQFVGGQDEQTGLTWRSQTNLSTDDEISLSWLSHPLGKAGLVGVGGLAATLMATPLLSQVQQPQAAPAKTAASDAVNQTALPSPGSIAVAPPSPLSGPEFSATPLTKQSTDPLSVVPIPAAATRAIRAPLVGQVLRRTIVPLDRAAASGSHPLVFPFVAEPPAETPPAASPTASPDAPTLSTLAQGTGPTPSIASPRLESPSSGAAVSQFQDSSNLTVATSPAISRFTLPVPTSVDGETASPKSDPAAVVQHSSVPSGDAPPLDQPTAFDLPPSDPVSTPVPLPVTPPFNEPSKPSEGKPLGLLEHSSSMGSTSQDQSGSDLPVSVPGDAAGDATLRGATTNERILGQGAAIPPLALSPNPRTETSIAQVEPLSLSIRAAITATNSAQINNLRIVQLSPQDYLKTWAALVAKTEQPAPEYGFIDHRRQTIIVPTM
jgi:hypothetical protein